MAEVAHARIKSIYHQLRGIYDEIPSQISTISKDIADDINGLINELNTVSSTDYSRHLQRPELLPGRSRPLYRTTTTRTRLNSLIQRLEAEYDLDAEQHAIQPQFLILNNNHNTNNIDIAINFTLQNLIDQAQSDDEKANLQIIDDELRQSNANWDKVKMALGWILSYSKELSLKVLPIILDYFLERRT